MKLLAPLLLLLCVAAPALAQTYPTCPNATGNTSCSMVIHVTAAVTPIFARAPSRMYLFLENTGYTFSSGTPGVNNSPVFCAVGSSNAPVTAAAGSANTIVIQPGGVYEPYQIVKPQTGNTVPAGDISCVAPLGDAWLAVLQE